MSHTPSMPDPPRSRQMFSLVDAHTASENLKYAGSGGCGCGGKGHGGGRGGCGGGHRHKVHEGGQRRVSPEQSAVEELVIRSIPKVVRRAVLFAAMEALPIGENVQIAAPHQPEPLFEHLRQSDFHYRVETLEAGPVDWRYRITRLS